ncbi:putative casein kinase I, partial [Mortierella sp. GBAus27b]
MGSSTTVIGGEYLVLGKIGEGSFGEVFRATHITSGVDYAIKREPINVAHPQLEHEAEMYKKLAGGVGIPNIHWFGKEGQYNAIVMDLLGPNLKQVRRENEKLPLSFVIELGVQVITQLEYIHKKGFVYRDVKPENFLLDADPRLSIVDFGLVAPYRDASGKHLPNKGSGKKHKVGTARYASINIHCGREHARRDDVESVGYMLLEFMIGSLPWSGISARNSRQGWAKMKDIKENTDMDELCDGLPRGFMTYIGYTRSLRFDEEPDYEYLRTILRN